jgi:hypothetical protein
MARSKKQPWEPPAWEGASVEVGREKEPAYEMPTYFSYTPPKAGTCQDQFNKLPKGQCLTQLTFDEGKPALRFCTEEKSPGKMVPVDSPEHALQVAREACDRFAQSGDYGLPDDLKIGNPGVKLVTGKLTLGKLPGLPAGGVAGMKKKSRTGIGALPPWAKCRHVGPLDAAKKKKLPNSAFGIPEKRAYPMPDPKHAANAKGRAKAQLTKGKLSQKDYNRIVRKANRVIGACKRK